VAVIGAVAVAEASSLSIGAVAVAEAGIGAVVGPSSSLNKAAAARTNSCGLSRTGVGSSVTGSGSVTTWYCCCCG